MTMPISDSEDILIVGTVHNVDVDHCAANIHAIGESLPGDYQVFLFENDSRPETVRGLQEWAARNRRVEVKHAVLGRGGAFRVQEHRTVWMAEYRNQYVAWIRSQDIRFRTVIVIDPDVTIIDREHCVRGVIDRFRGEYDMMGARGEYDTFAYRDRMYPWNNELHDAGPPHFQRIVIPEVRSRALSCFGGIGIYRREMFELFEYEGVPGVCEHVPFHRKMVESGYDRIFVEPEMKVTDLTHFEPLDSPIHGELPKVKSN